MNCCFGVVTHGGLAYTLTAFSGGLFMEPHGGYLGCLDGVQTGMLVQLARHALAIDGQSSRDCALLVSLHSDGRLARLAYDAPFSYGRRGARWYQAHHALAKLLSETAVHTFYAYMFDPEEEEQVLTFSEGQYVGGERVRYQDAHLTEDEEGELDEVAFEKLKARWPLGHLGTVLGTTREELLHLPRVRTVWLPLEGPVSDGLVLQLFPPVPRIGRITREFRLLDEISGR